MKRLLLMVFVGWSCGGDLQPKSAANSGNTGANSTTEPDMGTAAEMQSAEDCRGLERFFEGDCLVPEKWVSVSLSAVSGLPESFEDPFVCATTLIDEDQARSFVTSNHLIEQTDDCIVTERLPSDEQAGWPYDPDPEGFSSATIQQGDNAWVLDTLADGFDGCITSSSGGQFEFGQTYDVGVPTGDADTTFFPATITIPDDPQQECPVIVPGEPLEVVWKASRARSVSVQVHVGGFWIHCRVEDTGEFTISPELTSLLPEDGGQYIEVQLQNFEQHYNAETGTVATFLGAARNACDFVD